MFIYKKLYINVSYMHLLKKNQRLNNTNNSNRTTLNLNKISSNKKFIKSITENSIINRNIYYKKTNVI